MDILQANPILGWILCLVGAAVVFLIYYARGETRKLALKLAALLIGFIGDELGKVTKEEVYDAARSFYKEYFPAALKPLISLGTFQAWTWLAFCWLRENLTAPEKRAEIAILASGLSLTPARRGKKNVG